MALLTAVAVCCKAERVKTQGSGFWLAEKSSSGDADRLRTRIDDRNAAITS